MRWVVEGVFSCHNYIGMGPSLISIYGSRAAQQKQFTKYSNKTLCMRKHRWSKQRLFAMLGTPRPTQRTPNPSSAWSQR
jgi:cytochrome c2